MSPSRNRRRNAAFTISELLIGLGLGGLLMSVILAMVLFSGRNFASLVNYTDMGATAMNTMDQLSRDIRQANALLDYSTNSIRLTADNNQELTYSYSPSTRTLTRKLGTNGTPAIVMRDCDSLSFRVYQRTPVEGTFEQYDVGPVNESKVVYVTWLCSRSIMGQKANSDSACTARIVMRVP